MTETIKQAVSALMDEEASEIEIHRLLRQFDGDASTRVSWIRFQQIRAVSQGEHKLSVEQHVSLHSKISQAIADEPVHALVNPSRNRVAWQKPAAGFAVAASLVVAVLVGINGDFAGVGESQQVVDGTSVPISSRPARAIDVQTVSTARNQLADFEAAEPELKELDEEKQRRLREYLLRHDQVARKNPYSRTVNFKQAGGQN